jgi:hypothetical protein
MDSPEGIQVNQKRYQKTQNFTLILNPLKRFTKMYKKVISKNVMEICTFSTFTHAFLNFQRI